MKKEFTLSNGIKMPSLGLGTWLIDEKEAESVVLDALNIGYRFIDTAMAYGNEKGIGRTLKNTAIKREDIFLQTKLVAEAKTYEEAKAKIEKSFEDLNVSYIDCMLIHAPQPWNQFREEGDFNQGNREAWKALSEFYKAGKIKAIGVSNFEIKDLVNLSECEVTPMVNQILTHVSNTDFTLLDYCKKQGILVQAYSPIGHGAILQDEELKKMAEKYHVSISQLCIRYTLQLGLVSLPKAKSHSHLEENFHTDFMISEEDMNILCSKTTIETYKDADIFPCYNKQMHRRS